MDFEFSEKTQALRRQLSDFMEAHVLPRLGGWNRAEAAGVYPEFMSDLKALAKSW